MMSGSGAAVVGLFLQGKTARDACNALREQGCFAVMAPVVSDAFEE